jgi:hypothetical protein
MVVIIERIEQLSAIHSADRAIVLVSVDWSPWPKESRNTMTALEESRDEWSPDSAVEFFDFWPDRDIELERWYDETCRRYAPQFELHGHGYGPFWWMRNGKILDCLTMPYKPPISQLQQRSRAVFAADA